MVTARFYVAEVNRRSPHEPEAAEVILKPAYNNGEGNAAWSKATPSGEIKLYISNPAAVQWFQERYGNRPNRDLHITFDDVEDGELQGE